MLRNVCFRTNVIPSANSNFDPARGFHSTTAPFCFEACAPTDRSIQTTVVFCRLNRTMVAGPFRLRRKFSMQKLSPVHTPAWQSTAAASQKAKFDANYSGKDVADAA